MRDGKGGILCVRLLQTNRQAWFMQDKLEDTIFLYEQGYSSVSWRNHEWDVCFTILFSWCFLSYKSISINKSIFETSTFFKAKRDNQLTHLGLDWS